MWVPCVDLQCGSPVRVPERVPDVGTRCGYLVCVLGAGPSRGYPGDQENVAVRFVVFTIVPSLIWMALMPIARRLFLIKRGVVPGHGELR